MLLSEARTQAPPAGRLLHRYRDVRARTLALVAPLSAEDCALQSMPDASPAKWHLAHTTWFFETFVVHPARDGYRAFDPAFVVLFNSYYNAVGDKHPRPERGLLSRPALDVVMAYRAYVDETMQACCERAATDAALASLIDLGLNHEQQHQELILTDILHLLSRNPLHPAYSTPAPDAVRPVESCWIRYRAGLANVGHDGNGFAFDNEAPRHRVWLEPFEIASRPVTNAEYAAFIDDGGYRRPELWLSMGGDWVQAGARKAPLYWRDDGGRWRIFTLQGEVDVDPHTPVCHLSYFEADAFARWSGARLPTELEWETAARSLAGPIAGNFVDRGAFHPLPQREPLGDAPVQMFGDVWEWTQSAYLAYPGYRPLPGAVGEYNGKFMCSQFVLRGGSCATPPGHVRASYRNFFPPDAQWQFSGVRLARDAD